MNPTESYELLRSLTSPVVAVTSERNGKGNGMISDAVVRASIVPEIPRLAVFIHKFNLSHDLIYETGRFGLHVLHREQWDLIWRLGFFSGRDRDKLADIPHRLGALGCPVLEDCYAWFECRVINLMDTGSSTCFLGEAADIGRGPGAEVMTAGHLRAHMPAQWREPYLKNLAAAQAYARERSWHIRPGRWWGRPGSS